MIPDRLKAFYFGLPPGLRRRAPPWLEDLGARLARRYFGPASTTPVRQIEAKLASFPETGAAELAAMIEEPRTHPRRAAEAAWTLARWQAERGAPAAALATLARMRAFSPGARPAERRLVEADCLIRLGRAAEARDVLEPHAADPEAALLLAAAQEGADAEAARLALIAAAFGAGAGGGVARADPALPLSLDNLDGGGRDGGATDADGARPEDAEPGSAELDGTGPLHVSVIVPVHLHWTFAVRLLASLARQTLPGARFEVILVNNGGPLPRPAPVPPAGAAFALRLFDCPAPGAYAARNLGATRAAGDLLVFTDADCDPAPGWLEALATAARAGPERLLAGPIRMAGAAPVMPGGRPNPYAAYDRLRGIPQERYVRLGYAATANLAVPRAVFERLGGFDGGRFSGGDAEFCRRAGRAGVPIALIAHAVVVHPVRSDWAALRVKARRVKGGQILGGSRRSRALWLMRTLTPPLRALVRFLRMPGPWPERRAAIGVLFRLWWVELVETGRLLAGGAPERR